MENEYPDSIRKKDNMRVLIVCSYKPQLPDGVAPFVREQVEALRAWKAESQEPRAKSEKVECEYYHIKGKGMIGYLREVSKLWKKIREFKPELIHAHYGLSCLVANMATKRCIGLNSSRLQII